MKGRKEMSNEKERVVSFQEVFLNSASIFIEYVDLIKVTYYPLIMAMRKHEDHILYDISQINKLSVSEVGDWYVARKHQNPLMDLIKEDKRGDIKSTELDRILDEQIAEVPELLSTAPLINMGNVLLKLFDSDNLLVKKFFIWYPTNNPSVIKDINTTFEPIMKYGEILTGPIDEALKRVPEDSTYAFSDITNINVLDSLGKLAYSSVIIPQEYGYNAEDGKFIIDFDALHKETVFKLDQFFATED